MEALAACADVITFDTSRSTSPSSHSWPNTHHRPPRVAALELAVDKATMRQRFFDAGVAVPDFEVLDLRQGAAVAMAAIGRVAGRAGWPVNGQGDARGYDGKGVWPLESKEAAAAAVERSIASGASTLLVRGHGAPSTRAGGPGGDTDTERDLGGVAAAVETTQVDGVCREVLAPGTLRDLLAASRRHGAASGTRGGGGRGARRRAVRHRRRGARERGGGPAPQHGHWSIEGATTSQFENHLRAVLSLPLGSTRLGRPRSPVSTCSARPTGPTRAGCSPGRCAVEGAHVHLYGKEARPVANSAT